MLQVVHYKNSLRYYFSFIVACVLFISSTHITRAASLLLSPSNSKVSVGNIVSVKILVNTDGKFINNADAILRFPNDLLDVMSISKTSSIFSLWVEEPRFSNYEGSISFNGGVPNPGFFGQNGEIVSIVFKAKKQGNASIVFADSAVRQNDGLGTDVLTVRQSANIEIGLYPQDEVPVINVNSNSVPTKPIVVSSTHPEQDSWYSNPTVSLSWNVPSGVTSIQTLLNKSPTATPTVAYDNSVSRRTFTDLDEGVSYFHIRYVNNIGLGQITHYKVQIDSTPPEKFSLNIKTQENINIVTLNARDSLSGIDYYSVVIDDNPAIKVKKDSLINDQYILPVQNPGDHKLKVTAYDKAGNYVDANSEFVSPPLVAPTLSVSPKEIQRGETVVINGKSAYPNSNVEVYTQVEDKEVKKYSVITNNQGSFSVTTDKIMVSGSMNIQSRFVFSDKIKSPQSQTITVQVNDTLLVRTSKSIIYTMSFILPAIIILLGLLFTLYLGWHKFFGLRKRVRDEVKENIEEIHKTLMSFKDELNDQLEKLEKVKSDRELNDKEEKIFKELRSKVDSIDEFIEKKLNKIK